MFIGGGAQMIMRAHAHHEREAGERAPGPAQGPSKLSGFLILLLSESDTKCDKKHDRLYFRGRAPVASLSNFATDHDG